MAWSSTSESQDDTPSPHYPSGSTSPGDGCGAGACTFVEFLEQRRQYDGSFDPHVPTVLLTPAACGHCQKLEDLRRGRNTDSEGRDHRMTVPDGALADQIAFEGNSCFSCVKMIYHKTPWLGDNGFGDTPLHYAARSGNLRMLFHFICLVGDEYGPEGAALVLRKLNDRRETALHEAIRLAANRCMAKLLMWVDPELAQYPGAGTSPLYLAVSLGYKHIAEMLLSTCGGNLSYSGPNGQNALHAAVHRPNGMIEMLLYWNKDLTKEKDQNGSTPLHSLVSAHSEDYTPRRSFPFPCIQFPLEKHAIWRVLDANPSAAYQHDSNGLLSIHIAALMDRKVAILILHKRCRGCIALRDKQGRSFLHIAVQDMVYRIVQYACQEPVFAPILNARDNDGNTSLHLAVEVEDLFIFCQLLQNPKVLLNVRNDKDETPLDLARSKTLTDFSYVLNPEEVIYRTLRDAGAMHSSFWRDQVQQFCTKNQLSSKKDEEEKEANRKAKEDGEKKDSDQLTDSTRTLGLGSVLITTMTFGATFAVPAAVKAGNNSNGGIPGTFSTWYFGAFMVANATAFVSSSIATLCLMFSGMSMVKLEIRRTYFRLAMFLASNSLTSLTIAFGLGIRTVLAPIGRSLSDGILFLTSIGLLYQTIYFGREVRLTYQPLYVRRGHKFVCWLFIRRISLWCIIRFWPFLTFFLAISHGPAN